MHPMTRPTTAVLVVSTSRPAACARYVVARPSSVCARCSEIGLVKAQALATVAGLRADDAAERAGLDLMLKAANHPKSSRVST